MPYYNLYLNPEPWAVGPLDIGRRGGKIYATMGRNQQLAAYQEAVRDEIFVRHYPEMIEPPIQLIFWFWRNRAEYTTPNQRQHRKHEADVTNLQKALEDALQGLLYENDRDVVDVHSYLVDQGPEVEGKILVWAGPGPTPADMAKTIPQGAWVDLHHERKDDNSWPPK